MIPVRRSLLEQTAKKIKKLKSLKWSKALDEAALELGFRNYRHYLNVSEKSKPKKQNSNLFKDFPELMALLKRSEPTEVAKICIQLGLGDDVKKYLLSIFEERGLALVGLIPNSAQKLEYEFKEFLFKPNEDRLDITGDFSIQVKSLFKENPQQKSAVKRSDRFQGHFCAQIDSNKNLILEEVSINDKAFWA